MMDLPRTARRKASSLGPALMLVLFIASLGTTSAADAPPVLQFDPFGSRPEETAPPRGGSPRELGSDPVLFSTIVRGDRSLVNLGGTILALHEESEGYRLLEVRAFDALFLKDGRKVRLEVKGPESDPS